MVELTASVRLIYDYASKSAAARAHATVYGAQARARFRVVDLESRFKFDCKRTGACCRGRALVSNVIRGESQVLKIRSYTDQQNIRIKGSQRADLLWLDGLEPNVRAVRVASINLGAGGLAYVGPHGYDCQFLDGNLCGVHPVKPVLCATAPIGFLLEHGEFGGKIHLAMNTDKDRICPECMVGPEQIVREWLEGKITNSFINDQRFADGWSRLGVGPVR